MADPIPHKKVSRSTKSTDLGHIINHYPIRRYQLKRWLPLIGGAFMVLAGIGLLINLLLNTRTAVQVHGPAILLSILPLPTAVYLLLLLGGIISMILAWVYWRDCITLYETGLIKKNRNKVQVWYYEDTERFDNDITQIMFGGSIIGEKMTIILEDESKRRFTIRNRYTRMEDLLQILRARVLPGLFQRARKHLNDGQVLHFSDKLKADAKGLEVSKNLIPYDDIRYKITQNTLKLHQDSDVNKLLFKSDITKIKNLDLLLDLLENPPKQSD